MSRSRNTIRGGKFVKSTVKSRDSKIPMKGQTNEQNAVAYCHNKKHFGYLTPNLIKVHGCLAKQCPLLEKYENNAYWIKRNIKKALAKIHSQQDLTICFDGIAMDTDNLDKLTNIYKTMMIDGTRPTITVRSTKEGDEMKKQKRTLDCIFENDEVRFTVNEDWLKDFCIYENPSTEICNEIFIKAVQDACQSDIEVIENDIVETEMFMNDINMLKSLQKQIQQIFQTTKTFMIKISIAEDAMFIYEPECFNATINGNLYADHVTADCIHSIICAFAEGVKYGQNCAKACPHTEMP